ncbi:sulfite exporter TauE/SafE family protein [Pseudobacteroides cellulosolvens]|uniref:sulfite exporter TauE/SafE family protein n=1 Tax=Pseudobacteroides cellulosolvens TaxID=35825 RepID=UPI001364DF97|nr:sulfite exporter TauE/SafE family protein [Pseudobacteroides cellulosolvens]
MILIILGFIVGTLGTLVGVGGGFILLPVLLTIYPEKPHEVLTAITLVIGFINSSTGALAHRGSGRIDFKSGFIFAAATVPASVLGTYLTTYLPVTLFQIILGIVMVMVSVLMFISNTDRKKEKNVKKTRSKFIMEKNFSKGDGTKEEWSYDIRVGVVCSAIAGFISSLVGLAGGVFHIPLMIRILGFPVLVAAATSQFVVIFSCLSGTITNIISGAIKGGVITAITISLGVVPGAFFGASISKRMKNIWIIRIFAVLLMIAALKIIISGVAR